MKTVSNSGTLLQLVIALVMIADIPPMLLLLLLSGSGVPLAHIGRTAAWQTTPCLLLVHVAVV
jgi:hypothetical protein